jgi:hypothetical protein
MNTYEKKQIFKERLFKHILDLDYESLQDVLAEGNPYGHLNMRYILPININIDRRENPGEENYFNGSHSLICCHFQTPLNIVWRWICRLYTIPHEFDEDEFILPNGLAWGNIDQCLDDDDDADIGGIISNIFMILYKEYYKYNFNNNEALLKLFKRISKIKLLKYDHEKEQTTKSSPLIKTQISFIMWACSDWTFGIRNSYRIKNLKYFKENILNYPKDTPWDKEHYTMMLVCHRNLFNEFIDKYSLTKKMATIILKELTKSLTDNCDNKGIDIWENLLKYGANEEDPLIYPETPFMKKMWKLRCVRLDPARWPSIEYFDDISVEELQAMYYGNPILVRLEIDE